MYGKVIFICTGNTCRSPMAEGMFRAMCAQAGLQTEISSAGVGTFAGLPPTDAAVRAAAFYGADIAAHRSRVFSPLMIEDGTLFVCMTQSHAAALTAMGADPGAIRVLDVRDPFGGDDVVYAACAEELHEKLLPILEELQ